MSASAGAAAIVLSMIGLSTIDVGSSDITIVGALALSGVGLGASVPSMSSLIANAVDVRDLGVVGASQQMLAQLGAATGIQIMQTVQAARENAVSLADSYSQAYSWARRSLAWAWCAPCSSARPLGGTGRGGTGVRSDGRYSVISLILAESSFSASPGCCCWSSIIWVMSPWALILPAMKACIPA